MTVADFQKLVKYVARRARAGASAQTVAEEIVDETAEHSGVRPGRRGREFRRRRGEAARKGVLAETRFRRPKGSSSVAIPSSRDASHCRHRAVTIFVVKALDKESHKDSYPSDSGVAAVARAYFVSRSGKGDDACKRGKRGRLSRGARA
jgi:hypothetical protein